MQTPTRHADVRRILIQGLATGLLLTQSALMTYAQEATPPPAPAAGAQTTEEKAKKPEEQVVVLEAYTVNGSFAGSLAAAADAKENNQAIVEVIASEDIGKLPDVSIADSLTRLTGVAAQRTNGRAQQISIRGLTGDFSTTMLNGREQVSTGENRGVEFDQYPAELLSSVVVYKTAAADLTTQGIAGTVDLQTVQPLSHNGRTIALNAYYKTTQYGLLAPGVKKDGNSFSAAYIDQLDGGKFGIALGYAHSLLPFEGEQYQAWGYNGEPGGSGAQMITGTKSYVRSSNLKRDGYMGVFEFAPNEDVHSTVDLYYSKFNETQELRGLEIPIFPGWSPAVLQPGFTAANGNVTQFTVTNVHPVVRGGDSFVRDDNLVAAGWNLQLFKKSSWPVTFDAGYSKIDRDDKNLELWSGFSANNAGPGDTFTITVPPGGIPTFKNTLSYNDPSKLFIADAAGWNGQSTPGVGRPGYYKGFRAKDELGQLKAFTKHELGAFFKDVEIGVSYTDHYKRDGQDPSDFVTFSSVTTTAAFPPVIGTTDMSFLGLMGGVAAYDSFAYLNSGNLGLQPNLGTDFVTQRFRVTEKISRPYVQFDIDNKIGTVPVTGNLGFQLNSVDQSSTGYAATGPSVYPTSGGAKYNDLAPSLNLNFKVADGTYIRFSAARQLARPRLYDMRASRNFSYNPNNANSTDVVNSPWSGDGGNPAIRPWKSNSIDLAFDKYFKDNMGYFSVALFDKKLLNYIYQQNLVTSFAGLPIPTGQPNPVLFEGVDSTPINGQGGNIKGAEATLSLSSELLTNKAIKGFGVVVGGAYTDSTVQPWGPGNGTSPISGLSRKVANITLYYERHGFSARVSEHYRSEYRAYVTTFGPPAPGGDVNPNGGFATTQPERQVDAQISYAIQSGPLKNLTFYLQAYNLNNSPLITFNNGNPSQVINYQRYGASYSSGVSYKF